MASLEAGPSTTNTRETTGSSPATPEVATPLDDLGAAMHLADAYTWLLATPPSERSLSILWAHWAHETARGQRMQGHNFAGLKGSGPEGNRIVAWTREARPTERVVRRSFRAYTDEVSGARDYLALLAERYPLALNALRRGDESDFVSALASGGYFTDEPSLYLRAVTRLAAECRRRKLAMRALQQPRERSAGSGEGANAIDDGNSSDSAL